MHPDDEDEGRTYPLVVANILAGSSSSRSSLSSSSSSITYRLVVANILAGTLTQLEP